jgi:hypothetical protein
MQFLLPAAALAVTAAVAVTPCQAQQMMCRAAAAISMIGYPHNEAIEQMLAACQVGNLIRVMPQDAGTFCDAAQPIAPDDYGMVLCTLGTPVGSGTDPSRPPNLP